MNKNKLPITSDLFFCFIALFFVFYALLLKIKANLALCIFLSCLLSLIVTSLVAIVLIKISNKRFLLKQNASKIEQLFDVLVLYSRQNLLDFFANFYKNDGLFSVIIDDGIFIESKNVFIYPIMTYDKIQTQTVLEVYKKLNGKRLAVIGKTYSDECLKIFKSKFSDVSLFTIDDVYLSLSSENKLPTITQKTKNNKGKLVKLIKSLFNKKHAKFFFISGITSLFLSPLVFFSKYYIVWGVVFLIFSATCYFFAPENERPTGIKIK